MLWLDDHHIHKGTLDGAIALANHLYWNIEVVEYPPYWFIYGGEKVILKTDSKEAVNAFLYGIGLAYGCLPDEILERLRKDLKQLVE